MRSCRQPFSTVVATLSALLGTIANGCSEPPVQQMDMDAQAEDAQMMMGLDAYDPTTLPDGAPNPCLSARDCMECTSRTPCGWCNGSCMAGEANGSYDGTCSGDQWLYRGAQCPGVGSQCPTHTDCDSCARDENSCGWCANTHQCMTGDSTGPANATGGCDRASGTWIYNLDMQVCQ